MTSRLALRILGVMAICAVAGMLFWLFLRLSLAQDSLEPQLLARLDGAPARIEIYIADIGGQLLTAGLAGIAVAAAAAIAWLLLINNDPPIGDASARAKRGSWAGLFVIALLVAAGLFWLLALGADVGAMMASDVGITAMMVMLALVVLVYWVSTALFVPPSTRVAVPLASVVGRR